jgi:hypothetical protein
MTEEVPAENQLRNQNEIRAVIGAQLTPAQERIERVLPAEYIQRSFGEAVTWLTGQDNMTAEEELTMESIRQEMGREHVIQVLNGGRYVFADKGVPLSRYLERDAATGTYKPVEIVVANFDRGGRGYVRELYGQGN